MLKQSLLGVVVALTSSPGRGVSSRIQKRETDSEVVIRRQALPSITQSQALRSLPAYSVFELYRIQRPPHNGERVCRMHAGRDLDTSGLQSGTPRKLVFYTLSCYCVPQQARGLHQSPGLQVALAQGLAAAGFSGGRGSSGGIVQLRVVKAVLEIQDIVDVSAVAQEEQT